MTIPSYDNRRSYAGDGSTTTFAFPPPFTANTDLVVQIRAADGTTATKALGVDYVVAGAGSPAGGSVTMAATPATGTTLIIYRDVPLTQSVDLQDGGPLPANTINRALDRITMWGQRLKEQVVTLSALASQTMAGLMSAADKTKLDGIQPGAQANTVSSVNGYTGTVVLVKGDIGLGNADNTSDVNKPISTAQQAAFDARLTRAGNLSDLTNAAVARSNLGGGATGISVFQAANTSTALAAIGASVTGTSLVTAANAAAARSTLGLVIGTDVQAYDADLAAISAITPSQGDILYYNGTAWARLAAGTSGWFLRTNGTGTNPSWVSIPGGGDLLASNNLSELTAAASTARANIGAAGLSGANFTGPVIVPNQSIGTADGNAANTKYVFDFFNSVYNVTVAPLASPTFTGNPVAPTPSAGDSDTSIATTAFVKGALGNCAGFVFANANITLTAADHGKAIQASAASPFNITLPAGGAWGVGVAGAAIRVFNHGTADVTIVRQGSDFIYCPPAGLGGANTSLTLHPGEDVELINRGGTEWDVCSGSWLASNAIAIPPKALAGLNAGFAVGDILYADTTTTLAKLAGVAGGNVLRSGGVGVAPSWGKVGLSTHVSGTLPIANGGTNITTFATGDMLYASAANTLSKLAIGSTGQVLAISGGVPAWTSSSSTWPSGTIYGLTLSQASTTTVGIAAGGCANEDGGAYNMALGSAIIKGLGAWAAGTGNGGLDTGSIAASTWYHVHLIRKDNDGTIDALLSLSATAPTMPAGYIARRRIGSIRTNGSSQITAFIQVGDDFIWTAPVMDRNGNSASGITTVTLSVPSGIRVKARLRGAVQTTTSNYVTMSVYSPEIADQTPMSGGAGSASLVLPVTSMPGTNGTWGSATFDVMTNTSAQVRISVTSSSTTGVVALQTDGWIDTRGRQ
ncbi:hypothetical protein ACETRX_33345 [Labrys portucalensis]|uniref:DUF1983 domain-containing protein n=1 Tax=Labrys neptuniae TaxID=376174 RepID=A0ABV6ZQT0_9HYPH